MDLINQKFKAFKTEQIDRISKLPIFQSKAIEVLEQIFARFGIAFSSKVPKNFANLHSGTALFRFEQALTQRLYEGIRIGKRVCKPTYVGTSILEKTIKRLITTAKLKYQREISLVSLLSQKKNGAAPTVGDGSSNFTFGQTEAV
jgi:hypothetical protein